MYPIAFTVSSDISVLWSSRVYMQWYRALQGKMIGNILTQKFPKFPLSATLAKENEIIFMFILFGNLYLYPHWYIISSPKQLTQTCFFEALRKILVL